MILTNLSNHNHVSTYSTQLYRINERGKLAWIERCLDIKDDQLLMVDCPVEPVGPWDFDKVTMMTEDR